MAREYRRIRAVPDPPVELAPAAPDYRAFALAAGSSIVLGLSIFGALVYGAVYLFAQLIPSLTVSHEAALTAVVGTVETREAGTNRWTVATAGLKLQEGDTVRTRENSRALLTFFDQSTATLYPLTELRVDAMRSNRFGTALRSSPRTILQVTEASGRALFGVAHLNPLATLLFDVQSNGAVAHLAEGSYIVKVTPNQTFEVVATRGISAVDAAGKEVVIHGGERTQVRASQPPDAPILAAEDLIENGAFTQADANGQPLRWDLVAPPPESRDVGGRTRLTSDESAAVVRFTRTGGTYHAEQGIRQTINQDVTDYSVVRLDARFKVFSQSVSGGGDQGSEYPLMLRVNYLDETGTPAFFVRGFYVQNTNNLPVTNGQLVKAGEWVDLTGENGLQLSRITPRPQFIQSVEVLASGHDYDSEIQKVSLVIE
jgi:hypothetical protein